MDQLKTKIAIGTAAGVENERRTQTTEQCDRVREQLDRMEDVLGTLIANLSSALRESDPPPDDQVVPSMHLVPLAGEFRSIGDQISEQCDRIEDVIHRLEL